MPCPPARREVGRHRQSPLGRPGCSEPPPPSTILTEGPPGAGPTPAAWAHSPHPGGDQAGRTFPKWMVANSQGQRPSGHGFRGDTGQGDTGPVPSGGGTADTGTSSPWGLKHFS